MLKGEIFGIAMMLVGAGALIAFIEWWMRGWREALGCKSHGPGEGPSGNRAPTHTHPSSHDGGASQ